MGGCDTNTHFQTDQVLQELSSELQITELGDQGDGGKKQGSEQQQEKNGGEFQLVCLLCLSQSFFGGDQSSHLFFILSLTRLLLHSLVLSPYLPVCPRIVTTKTWPHPFLPSDCHKDFAFLLSSTP